MSEENSSTLIDQANLYAGIWNTLIANNNALWTFYGVALAATFAFVCSEFGKSAAWPVRSGVTLAFLLFALSNMISLYGHIDLHNATMKTIHRLNNPFLDPVFKGKTHDVYSWLVIGMHLVIDAVVVLCIWGQRLFPR